jgi:GNAT superfamily N-acetyltransferase
VAGVTIAESTAAEVRPLRQLVLRPGRPIETTFISRDDDPATWHLAAREGDRLVGVMTLFADQSDRVALEPAERFRWMAVHPEWQGRGVGRALLHEAARRLRARGVRAMWAHGRDSAQGFYERFGFAVAGEGFIDPDTDVSHHIVWAAVDTVLERSGPGVAPGTA